MSSRTLSTWCRDLSVRESSPGIYNLLKLQPVDARSVQQEIGPEQIRAEKPLNIAPAVEIIAAEVRVTFPLLREERFVVGF